MRLVLAVLLLVSGVATADERVALFIGANLGGPDDEPLRYAEADARRMRALLLEVGEVAPERAILVLPHRPAEILAALAELSHRTRISELVVYYSGHGDDAALHLGEGFLPLEELRHAMAAIPAHVRMLFVDACRGVRDKGVTRGPAITTTVEPEGPSGRIELRASSVGEAAQESDELGGSIYTHFLVSALRGGADADQDGRVTLAELYAYVYRRTLLRTGTSGALQHPTLDAAIAGAGEIVLTRPVRAAATLEVPAGDERYLVFQLPRGIALGEIGGDAGHVLALPTGRFLVVRRASSQIAVAEIDLPWGGRRVARADEFRKMSREELIARGGRVELRPFRLDVRLGTELALGSVESAAGTVTAALAYTRGALETEAALGYVGSRASFDGFSGGEHAVRGRVAVGFRLVAGRVTVNPALGLDARWSFQRLSSEEPARRLAAGLPTTRNGSGGELGPDLALRVGLSLPRHLVLSPLVAFAFLLRQERTATAPGIAFHPTLELGLGLGYAF